MFQCLLTISDGKSPLCHGDVGKPEYGKVVKIKVKDPLRIKTIPLGNLPSTLRIAQTRSSKFRPVDLRLLLLKMTAATVSSPLD